MRQGIIDAGKLTDEGSEAVWKWLRANGCRRHVPRNAVLLVRGNYVEVPCWETRAGRTAKRLRSVRIHIDRTVFPFRIEASWSVPCTLRRFRIRHPLRLRAEWFK